MFAINICATYDIVDLFDLCGGRTSVKLIPSGQLCRGVYMGLFLMRKCRCGVKTIVSKKFDEIYRCTRRRIIRNKVEYRKKKKKNQRNVLHK